MEDETFITIDKVNLNCTWKINYDELVRLDVGGKIWHDFLVDYFDFNWRLAIYPKGVYESNEPNTDFFIYLMASKQFPINADIFFYILNAKGHKCNKYSFHRTFDAPAKGGGKFNFISIRDLLNNNFVTNNTVTVFCEIFVQIPAIDASNKKLTLNDDLNLNTLSQDLQKIMKISNLSDVILKVQGQKLVAHKIILSARSPVFEALFNSNMKENIQNEINIDDVELDVFKEMLRFIYTGKLKNLEKLAYELFILSDRYQLKDLKNTCGLYLSKNVTIDNAIDIFVLLDRHSAIKLKNKVLDFIARNIKSIVNLDTFKDFEQTNPSLAIEIFRSAVTR